MRCGYRVWAHEQGDETWVVLSCVHADGAETVVTSRRAHAADLSAVNAAYVLLGRWQTALSAYADNAGRALPQRSWTA